MRQGRTAAFNSSPLWLQRQRAWESELPLTRIAHGWSRREAQSSESLITLRMVRLTPKVVLGSVGEKGGHFLTLRGLNLKLKF